MFSEKLFSETNQEKIARLTLEINEQRMLGNYHWVSKLNEELEVLKQADINFDEINSR